MMEWVTITEDHVDQALAWAKKNCDSYITNDARIIDVDVAGKPGWITTQALYRFYFGKESDATMFALRWS